MCEKVLNTKRGEFMAASCGVRRLEMLSIRSADSKSRVVQTLVATFVYYLLPRFRRAEHCHILTVNPFSHLQHNHFSQAPPSLRSLLLSIHARQNKQTICKLANGQIVAVCSVSPLVQSCHQAPYSKFQPCLTRAVSRTQE